LEEALAREREENERLKMELESLKAGKRTPEMPVRDERFFKQW
jgi:hypothetical protein